MFPFQLPAATSILLTIALAHLARPLLAAAAVGPAPDMAPRREQRKISGGFPARSGAATFEDAEAAGKRNFPEDPSAGMVHNVTAVPGARSRGEVDERRTKREPERRRKRIKIYPLLCG